MRNTNPTLTELLDRLDDLVDGSTISEHWVIERSAFRGEITHTIRIFLAQRITHAAIRGGNVGGTCWIEVDAPTRERALSKAVDLVEDVITTGRAA